jgi:hypothetical protein
MIGVPRFSKSRWVPDKPAPFAFTTSPVTVSALAGGAMEGERRRRHSRKGRRTAFKKQILTVGSTSGSGGGAAGSTRPRFLAPGA